jgi:hypothetical protein
MVAPGAAVPMLVATPMVTDTALVVISARVSRPFQMLETFWLEATLEAKGAANRSTGWTI